MVEKLFGGSRLATSKSTAELEALRSTGSSIASLVAAASEEGEKYKHEQTAGDLVPVHDATSRVSEPKSVNLNFSLETPPAIKHGQKSSVEKIRLVI